MNRVAESRKNKGLTQLQVAQKAGISRVYLSTIETGNQEVISNVVMDKIAKALGESVSSLFYPECKS